MRTTAPVVHLADTYSFGESQGADASFKRSLTYDVELGQTDAVPDMNLSLRGTAHLIVFIHLFKKFYPSAALLLASVFDSYLYFPFV